MIKNIGHLNLEKYSCFEWELTLQMIKSFGAHWLKGFSVQGAKM